MTLASNPSTAAAQRMTLEEYWNFNDGTETRHELVDGVLVEMGAESTLNIEIGSFLFAMFLQVVPHYLIHKGTEVETPAGQATSRYPDLLVLTEACAAALKGQARSIIRAGMPSPALVVEMVSPGEPGELNYDRDYVHKPAEYATRGIPEYWIVDPHREVVVVLKLNGNAYSKQEFREEQVIISALFPTLKLSAPQVLSAGQ